MLVQPVSWECRCLKQTPGQLSNVWRILHLLTQPCCCRIRNSRSQGKRAQVSRSLSPKKMPAPQHCVCYVWLFRASWSLLHALHVPPASPECLTHVVDDERARLRRCGASLRSEHELNIGQHSESSATQTYTDVPILDHFRHAPIFCWELTSAQRV